MMPIHISNKKVNDIHVGTKKVLTAWVGTDRVFLASTLSMLIKGYTEKSGDSLLSANTPFKFTGKNILKSVTFDSYKFIQEVKAGDTYTVSGVYNYEGTSDSHFGIYVYAEKSSSSRWIASILVTGTYGERKSGTITVPEDGYLFFRLVRPQNYVYFEDVQIEEGTLTDYEPYHETFYNPAEGFSLNGFNDIYDTFNTINGEFNNKIGVLDLGKQMWRKTENLFYTLSTTNLIKRTQSSTQLGNILCPIYENKVRNNFGSEDMSICSDINGYLWITNSNYEDVNAFTEAMNNIYLAYELATPQTYQKKPKTLPQWVKHVFDSSGRELEATITQ